VKSGRNEFPVKIGPKEIVEINDTHIPFPIEFLRKADLCFKDATVLRTLLAFRQWMIERHLDPGFEISDE